MKIRPRIKINFFMCTISIPDLLGFHTLFKETIYHSKINVMYVFDIPSNFLLFTIFAAQSPDILVYLRIHVIINYNVIN